MTQFLRRKARQPMPSIKSLIKTHPELVPIRKKDSFQPVIASAGKWIRKPNVTEAERHFARVLDKAQIGYIYEPFILSLERYPNGSVRGFQPDFWIPELGLVVELCAKAQAKNQKIRLTSESWPNLAVLVLTDAQVKDLAGMGLTRWQMVSYFHGQLEAQVERIAREGDDPFGYRPSTRKAARVAAKAARSGAARKAKAEPAKSKRRGRGRRRAAPAPAPVAVKAPARRGRPQAAAPVAVAASTGATRTVRRRQPAAAPVAVEAPKSSPRRRRRRRSAASTA